MKTEVKPPDRVFIVVGDVVTKSGRWPPPAPVLFSEMWKFFCD